MALDPATIAEGPLGLEGEHVWNGLVVNVNTVFPRYKLKRITGLRSKPDSDDLRDPARGTIGEIPYPSQPRGKTIVYSGVIEALTLPSLRAAITAIQTAFADTKTEKALTLRPATGRGGIEWFAIGKSLSCDVDDEQLRGMNAVYIHAREFTFSIRLSDPRFYVTAPVEISGAAGATVAATNLGPAPADPVFTINGPITMDGFTVERVGGPQPRILTFKPSIAFAAISAGRTLVVQFGRLPRAYSPQIGGDFTTLIDFASTWWNDESDGIHPGAQNIKVTEAAWSMNFYHASW